MAQTTLFPPAEIPEVHAGDIFLLGGRHRLMCGDATNKDAVAHLFGDDAPTLVVTSPPYANQRDYDRPIRCWDSMMIGALSGHSFSENVQLLVNLGIIHKNEQVCFYYNNWLRLMQEEKWRIYAQYCWSKGNGAPGCFKGRLRPSHEFVFHFNKSSFHLNKWMPTECKRTSRQLHSTKKKDGTADIRKPRFIQTHKAPDSVIKVAPVRFGESSGHPAQMPVALAAFLIRTWKRPGCVAYDPFGGSGTTILAAETEDVTGLAMEISEKYCQIALRRWAKEHPDKPIRKIQ